MAAFDGLCQFPYNRFVRHSIPQIPLRRALIDRQLPSGGWSYGQASAQADLEPSCLALVALRWDSSPSHARGLQFLLGAQNPDGSWPAFQGDDQEGSGLTPLAVTALASGGIMTPAVERALK